MPSVAERLAAARRRLEAAGLDSTDAALDAEVLARHLLGWDRGTLLARSREPEPLHFPDAFDSLIARRVQREPVAQIVGVREFWERDFEVTPDVLIPRPETEIIVEEAVAFCRTRRCRNIIDVGTGSGCLAVTIACELLDVKVTATDLSEAALAVARRNAHRYGVADRLTFVNTDVLLDVRGTAELILSNPPYVPDADAATLQPEVVRYEPHAALFGGKDGLDVIGRLFTQAHTHLADDGLLIVEFGFGQAAGVASLARKTGWRVERIREDLQGIPRTILLRRSSNG
jgi:release factor glutamine methyltransferase